MAVVVNFHRARVNVRFERVEGVRQSRQREGSARSSSSWCGLSERGGHNGGNRGCERGGFEGLASGHHGFVPFLFSSSARNVRSSASFSRWVCLVFQSSCGLAKGIFTPAISATVTSLLASS